MSIQRTIHASGQLVPDEIQEAPPSSAAEEVAHLAIAHAAALPAPQARLTVTAEAPESSSVITRYMTHRDVREYLLAPQAQKIIEYANIRSNLETGKQPSEGHFSAALAYASNAGHLTTVKFLVETWGTGTRENFILVIIVAIRLGHLEIVRYLCSAIGSLTQGELGWLATNAASSGHLEILQDLLSDGRTLSEQSVGEVLFVASESGRLDILRFLLSDGRSVSEEHLGRALRNAVLWIVMNSGDLDILNFFFEDGRTVLQVDLGLAVEVAACAIQLPVIRLLLSHGRTIDQAFTARCVDKAVRAGDLAAVQFLLSEGRTMSNAAFQQVFHEAIRENHLEIVRFIIAVYPTLGERALGLGLKTAARWGYIELVQLLVATGRIHAQIYYGGAIENAAAAGHLNVVRYLIPLTQGSFLRFNQVMLISAARGWGEVLAVLLERGPISRTLRDSCISQAYNNTIRDLMQMAALAPEDHGPQLSPYDPGRMTLSFEDLKKRPAIWLNAIFCRGMPSSICFTEYPLAIDLGGVMKQFISTLVESLITNKVFLRTEKGLLCCETTSDQQHLRQLGKFYSDLDLKNSMRADKFLTGLLLHPRFLELVVITVATMSEEEKLRQAALLIAQIDPEQQIIASVLLRPEAHVLRNFQEIMGCASGEEEAEARAMIKSFLKAASAFYEGSTACFQAKILKNPVETLQAIQGEKVSNDAIIAALICHGRSPSLQRKFDWIKEKILAADPDFCLKFLKAITGKTTLAPSDKIKIKETWKMYPVFEIHTCFSSLDVPREDLDQQDFLRGLEGCLDECYNTA